MSWLEYWNSNSNINYKILSKWSEFYCKGIKNLNLLNIDDNVLDYGAGTGEISAYISSQVKSVLAYDKWAINNLQPASKDVPWMNAITTGLHELGLIVGTSGFYPLGEGFAGQKFTQEGLWDLVGWNNLFSKAAAVGFSMETLMAQAKAYMDFSLPI